MNVTILTPIWAREQTDLAYLAQCLESTRPHPHIVVDDGSPLDIMGVCLDFKHVKIERIEHAGKSKARNLAASLAETDLIFPLDADDWIEPGAIEYLVEQWRGVPLYSWIFKWYNESRSVEHHLPEFSCQGILNTFAISAVNVLHSREQWQQIGGWDERFNLFEDWHYNARLFWTFCGQLIARPLVYYRQHGGQSTKYYKADAGRIEHIVRDEIRAFAERAEMACCGKRKRGEPPTVSATMAANSTRQPVSASARTRPPREPISFTAHMPTPPSNTNTRRFGALLHNLSGNIVEARYVGSPGAGPHHYRGTDTRIVYNVRYGATLQAAIEDTCSEEERREGRSRKLLVRVEPSPPPPPPPPPVAPPPPPPRPSPRPEPVRPPLEPIVADLEPLPETVRELREKADAGITRVQAVAWLEEERGKDKPRITVVKLLEKITNG